ncbi:unnamed protein product [Rhizophagus irregularis]|uniref:Uncharacterized protein n=1 Tax=Rhizophagus irregularis TaxID=588596 RepID=A0A916EIA4_9GLOM|nr:unnamed protein product [Rhizophagus irregularis]CAB5177986.1 unnamed protein product [Rhizophagus irregularis]CAB5393403.1 unnamed protein product [Rhizophagus irregularis]
MSSVEATKDADKGTWRKKFVTRLEKIVNDEQRNERTYHVKCWKTSRITQIRIPVSDTEESDIEESDMEVIDAGQNSKEIDDLSQDETGIRNKFFYDVIREKIKNSLDIGQFTWLEESCIIGRFDSSYYEAHDIAQQILTHFSVYLETPIRI